MTIASIPILKLQKKKKKNFCASKFPKNCARSLSNYHGKPTTRETCNFHAKAYYSPHILWSTGVRAYERNQTVGCTVIGIEDCHLVHPSLLDGSCLDGSPRKEISRRRASR